VVIAMEDWLGCVDNIERDGIETSGLESPSSPKSSGVYSSGSINTWVESWGYIAT
jgi:hypothetical protein